MAIAQELPIYKEMYILFNLILDARTDFPKAYKYAFGEKLMMVSLECLELIQAANMDRYHRAALLQEFAIKYGTLQLMLRVCRDRYIIQEKAFANILEHAGQVGRMATGWRNATVKPESPTPNRYR